jgi:hypothetical protein
LVQVGDHHLTLPDASPGTYDDRSQYFLMPAHKLKPQKLHCPFCSSTSTRGTGLSAHVRSQHPAQYRKWNRNPNRIAEAATAPRPEVIRKAQPIRPPAPVQPDNVTAPDRPVAEQPFIPRVAALQVGENSGDEALTLLQRAYEQLTARKQTIESELAQMEAMRNEQEAITAQIAALDQAIEAFHPQPLGLSVSA